MLTTKRAIALSRTRSVADGGRHLRSVIRGPYGVPNLRYSARQVLRSAQLIGPERDASRISKAGCEFPVLGRGRGRGIYGRLTRNALAVGRWMAA